MIVNHCVHWRVKICAIEKPFIDASLVIMTNNNRCLFSSQGSFALSKMLIYPALQSTKQHSMAYADVKHSENPPCWLRLTLSRRPAIIRFVILNTKCYSLPMREKNLWKTIAFTKWRPARREKVDVNQLFEMINTCIRNFKILIK